MEKDVQAILNLLSEGAVVEGDIQTPISTNRPD